MSVRKNFNAEEKSLLHYGTAVEWKDGTRWLRGAVIGEGYDPRGFHYAVVRNLQRGRGCYPGEHVRSYPGHLRRGIGAVPR
jgi:hypothetical protein